MSVGNVSVFKALLQRQSTTRAQVEESFCKGLRESVCLNEQAIAEAATRKGIAAPTLTPQQVDAMDLRDIQCYADKSALPDFAKAPRVEALGTAYGAVVASLRGSAITAACDVGLLTVGGPVGVALLALAVPIQAVVGAVQIHRALSGLQGVPMKDLNGRLDREVATLKDDRSHAASDAARQAERDQLLATRIALLDEAHKTDPSATAGDLFQA